MLFGLRIRLASHALSHVVCEQCTGCTAALRVHAMSTWERGGGGAFSIEKVKPKACSKATPIAKENQEAGARSKMGRN